MDLFKKFKDYTRKVNEIEYSISNNKKEFIEIYERNLALEKEIVQRTQELDQANKAFLTLKHVWELMNSSEPLSSVLQKLVNSLHGEMGYINSTILQVCNDDKGKYYKVKAFSESPIFKKLIGFLNEKNIDIHEYHLKYDPKMLITRAIEEKSILYTKDYLEVINNLLYDFKPEHKEMINKLGVSKSVICIPLSPSNSPFGVMMVFSPREDVTDKELNFLTLFANQVEMAITIANLFENLKKEAVTDSLTELYNRRYFNQALQKEAERAQRLHQPFSLISLDLDYLKKINDTYGHFFGDLAIRTIADILKKNARSIDVPARLGGEEFSVLLPGVDSSGAMIAAERIRAAIEAQELDTIGHITASVGVGTFPEHSIKLDELLDMTDQAMYKSKINGRNRVTMAKSADDEAEWHEVAFGAFMDILTKQKVPIPNKIAKEITSKLKSISTIETKDTLFSVADTIAQTYNNHYKRGLTKAKVSMAIELARKMELTKEDIDKLKIAMMLYDIGKLMIPEEILNKKEPLTDEEKQQIKEHPLIAARKILKPITAVADIVPIIEAHHENWDGTGYPQKLSGDEIPVSSQIILLIDAYFALTQSRPYRVARSKDEAIEIIRLEAGKKWNEKLVEEFVGLMNEHKQPQD
ncbi:MAG TPA: diguanylate cyclase [Candidatus Limenecus avicola]|jgi:gaf domain/ggdef domain protein|uniref:Diguanylate cyclase n=1 Tax=Candidatus Limenecus avicola TaxID=2840847 RepID=A0A9D1MYK6_9CLOT|nr:diguanylate cyclase and metal dependent phosphohydrolase [Clostridium sp. CAG:306]HIU91549.1 diguanylate cyclase [Candidatus Limenecus avicola]